MFVAADDPNKQTNKQTGNETLRVVSQSVFLRIQVRTSNQTKRHETENRERD